MAQGFTDEDLDAAVVAGALPAEAAASFRVFVERRRSAPAADEESFRLLTGFNDIFVAIALVLTLAALGWMGFLVFPALSGALVAVASWALALFFTNRRRMALPSILLLLTFIGGAVETIFVAARISESEANVPGKLALVGLAGLAAAFAHWRFFKVPITVAAGVATVGAVLVSIVGFAGSPTWVYPVVLGLGLATFALALAWDASDPLRRTRRSDVAFWLHLIAAPAIAHPAFSLLGLQRSAIFAGAEHPPPLALGVGLALSLYAALAIVALIVDRRALMVSSLAYLIYAMNALFHATGALTTSFALSALIVGAALLLLSAFWATARRGVLRLAPTAWRPFLPPAA
jgi:hypothetical protein